MTQRFLLTTAFHDHKISTNSIHEILKGKATLVNWSVDELKDDDFIVEDIEPNVTKKRIRGPLNLRRETNTLKLGNLCTIEELENSPIMLIEHELTPMDLERTGIKGSYANSKLVQCCWFHENKVYREIFKIELLKKYTQPEPVKKASSIPDSTLYNISMNDMADNHQDFREYVIDEKKIQAIKVLRAITGLGLKEAKDMVEAVTPIMIANWQQGIFE